jgi:hypothetical protein
MKSRTKISAENYEAKTMMKSHKEYSYENYEAKSAKSHHEISLRPKKHENPVTKSHTKYACAPQSIKSHKG